MNAINDLPEPWAMALVTANGMRHAAMLLDAK